MIKIILLHTQNIFLQWKMAFKVCATSSLFDQICQVLVMCPRPRFIVVGLSLPLSVSLLIWHSFHCPITSYCCCHHNPILVLYSIPDFFGWYSQQILPGCERFRIEYAEHSTFVYDTLYPFSVVTYSSALFRRSLHDSGCFDSFAWFHNLVPQDFFTYPRLLLNIQPTGKYWWTCKNLRYRIFKSPY